MTGITQLLKQLELVYWAGSPRRDIAQVANQVMTALEGHHYRTAAELTQAERVAERVTELTRQ